MFPIRDIMPEIILIADRIQTLGAEGLLVILRRGLRGEIEGQKGGRIASGVGYLPELDPLNRPQRCLDRLFVFSLLGDNIIEFPQLGQTQRPLDLVHPVIEAEDGPAVERPVGRLVIMAVIVVPIGTIGELLVVSQNHPAFTRSHGFYVIKAEDAHVAEGTELFPPETGAAPLGIILQHQEVVLAGHLNDPVNPRRRAAHVDGNNRLRVRGNLPRHVIGVQTQRGINIRHYGDGPHLQDRLIGSQKGKCRHEYFVAGTDIHGRQRHLEGGRTGRHPEGIFCPAVFGKGRLEFLALENALPFLIKIISDEDACLQHLHYLLYFFLTDHFRTSHDLPSLPR